MTNKDFFQIGLPKWPALLVFGKPVNREQAKEILIRTDNISFSTNDYKFKNQLDSYIYGIPIKGSYGSEDEAIMVKLGITKETPGYWEEIWKYKSKVSDGLKILDLNYLCNHRIVSCWIGGPHGWCNWDGSIYSSNYNIGKYPTVEEVYKEWRVIAKAFPFLDLKCQLMNHEESFEDTVVNPGPVVEYWVKNGKVKMYEPKKKIVELSVPTEEEVAFNILRNNAERGCTIEQFKDAVDYVRNKFK